MKCDTRQETIRAQLATAVAGEAVRIRGEPGVIRWDDVALLALDRWTLRTTDEVLDQRRNGSVPPLNHFGTIRIRIPGQATLNVLNIARRLARKPENAHLRPHIEAIEKALHRRRRNSKTAEPQPPSA